MICSTSVDSIEVYPMLDGIQITGNPDTLFACPGSSLILSFFPATGGLVWSVTGPAGFSSNSRNVLVASSLAEEMFGNYAIGYLSPDGCELHKTLVPMIDSTCETSAVWDHSGEQPVVIYPNPVSRILYLDGLSGESLVEISNMLGEICYSISVNGRSVEIDCSGLTPGLYHLQIRNKDAVLCRTIVRR